VTGVGRVVNVDFERSAAAFSIAKRGAIGLRQGWPIVFSYNFQQTESKPDGQYYLAFPNASRRIETIRKPSEGALLEQWKGDGCISEGRCIHRELVRFELGRRRHRC
jgi:hypothetical protein